MPSTEDVAEPLRRAARAGLPDVNGVDLDELADAYATVVPGVVAELRWRFVVADLTALVLLVYLGLIAGRLIASAPASSPPWAVLVAASAYGLVIIAGGVLVSMAATALRTKPPAVDLTMSDARSPLLTFATTRLAHTALVMTVLITGLITPIDELEALWFGKGFDAFRRAAGLSSAYVAFFAGLALIELCLLIFRYHAQEERVRRPGSLDRVATRLVVIAVTLRRCAERPDGVRDREVRSVVSALERTAREAKRALPLSVPLWDRATRRDASIDGARLAEVIRAHKASLLRAGNEADLVRVARSLTGGLGAWARGDLAAMVRDAPAVAPVGLQRWLVRLWPAFVLAGLGVVLPLLPPLNGVAQAATAARTSLLAGAIMAIVSGSVQAPEYVQKVLEQTASRGGE